ncbi:LOW QUALITY PROTEIN: prostaglandin E2 receptor EP2 subtype-like [Dreissena polymorpha]|uniref:LOW QUALITY PROTEIN: prostaglandin E2 receptor EP2 subtype-like n=1 Tax=Dreissena polymorpha TaxID=45954 RepID=UPI002263D479|nr:LOW QUALITY PROTEIN: prostaglandin E2 receptor EP2 subtype-like [Dreissena polymorpha]
MAAANYSGILNLNKSDVHSNLTSSIMRLDNDLDSICNGIEANSSACDKKGLGISLATPIAMFSSGVIGNIIALIVLYTARTRMKKSLYYILLSALAWTDLLGQLLVGPIAIIVYANNLKWVGGQAVCKYHGFFMVSQSLIIPIFVCCLSVERVLAITFPYCHERVLTRRKIYVLIASCLLFVAAFCSLPFLGFGSYAHQFPGSWCFLNFHRESPTDTAFAYTYGFLNVGIISTIIIMNAIVMVTLIQMRRRKLNTSPTMKRRMSGSGRSKLKIEEETQMMWFLGAITIVFTTCWFPLTIHILINQTTGRVNYRADLIGVRLASINQILDPWLYILLRKSVIVKILRTVKGIVTFTSTVDHKTRPQTSKYVTNHDVINSDVISRHDVVYHTPNMLHNHNEDIEMNGSLVMWIRKV